LICFFGREETSRAGRELGELRLGGEGATPGSSANRWSTNEETMYATSTMSRPFLWLASL
jgi:hypothetical protein